MAYGLRGFSGLSVLDCVDPPNQDRPFLAGKSGTFYKLSTAAVLLIITYRRYTRPAEPSTFWFLWA